MNEKYNALLRMIKSINPDWETPETKISMNTAILQYNYVARLISEDIVISIPLDLSSLTNITQYIASYLADKHFFTAELILNFLNPVLIRIGIDTPFFMLAFVVFLQLHSKYPNYTPITKIVATLLIRTRNLPVKFLLCHIDDFPDKEAETIVTLFSNPNESESNLILALALAIPSISIDLNRIPFKLPEETIHLPGPKQLLINNEYFSDEEKIYAAYLLQCSHGITNIVGKSDSPLEFSQMVKMQKLITMNTLSSGCLSHSLYLLTQRSSTASYALKFIHSLDNKCGIELLRELFVGNITPCFIDLISNFGNPIFSLLNLHRSNFSPDFIRLINPFWISFGNDNLFIQTDPLFTETDNIKTLSYFNFLYFLLVRLSFEPKHILVSFYLQYTNHIRRIIADFMKDILFNADFSSALKVDLTILIINFFFEIYNKINIPITSIVMVKSSLYCLRFVTSAPLPPKIGYRHIFVQRASQAIQDTFKKNADFYLQSLQDRISPSIYPTAVMIGVSCQLPLKIIEKMILICMDSSVPDNILKCIMMIRNQNPSDQIGNLMSNLVRDGLISPDKSHVLYRWQATNLILILTEFLNIEGAAEQFIQTDYGILFHKLTSNMFEKFRQKKQAFINRVGFIPHVLVSFFCKLYESVESLPFPPMRIEGIILSFKMLRFQRIRDLLKLSILVSLRSNFTTYPYEIDWTYITTNYPNETKEFIQELTTHFKDITILNSKDSDLKKEDPEFIEEDPIIIGNLVPWKERSQLMKDVFNKARFIKRKALRFPPEQTIFELHT